MQIGSVVSLVTVREALTTWCQAQGTAWKVCNYRTTISWCKHTVTGWTRLSVHISYLWAAQCHGLLTIWIAPETVLTCVIRMAAVCLKPCFLLLTLIFLVWTIPGLSLRARCMASFPSFQVKAKSFSLQNVKVAAWSWNFSSCFKGVAHKLRGQHEPHVGCNTKWLKEGMKTAKSV